MTNPELATILKSKYQQIDNTLLELESELRRSPLWQDPTAEDELGDILSGLLIAGNQLERLADRLTEE